VSSPGQKSLSNHHIAKKSCFLINKFTLGQSSTYFSSQTDIYLSGFHHQILLKNTAPETLAQKGSFKGVIQGPPTPTIFLSSKYFKAVVNQSDLG